MVLHTMFYEDEIRRADEYRADVESVNLKELELATRLIDALAVPFDAAKYKDSYREKLKEYIGAVDPRVAGRGIEDLTYTNLSEIPAPGSRRGDAPIDLRMYVSHEGRAMSETWLYQAFPSQLHALLAQHA